MSEEEQLELWEFLGQPNFLSAPDLVPIDSSPVLPHYPTASSSPNFPTPSTNSTSTSTEAIPVPKRSSDSSWSTSLSPSNIKEKFKSYRLRRSQTVNSRQVDSSSTSTSSSSPSSSDPKKSAKSAEKSNPRKSFSFSKHDYNVESPKSKQSESDDSASTSTSNNNSNASTPTSSKVDSVNILKRSHHKPRERLPRFNLSIKNNSSDEDSDQDENTSTSSDSQSKHQKHVESPTKLDSEDEDNNNITVQNGSGSGSGSGSERSSSGTERSSNEGKKKNSKIIFKTSKGSQIVGRSSIFRPSQSLSITKSNKGSDNTITTSVTTPTPISSTPQTHTSIPTTPASTSLTTPATQVHIPTPTPTVITTVNDEHHHDEKSIHIGSQSTISTTLNMSSSSSISNIQDDIDILSSTTPPDATYSPRRGHKKLTRRHYNDPFSNNKVIKARKTPSMDLERTDMYADGDSSPSSPLMPSKSTEHTTNDDHIPVNQDDEDSLLLTIVNLDEDINLPRLPTLPLPPPPPTPTPPSSPTKQSQPTSKTDNHTKVTESTVTSTSSSSTSSTSSTLPTSTKDKPTADRVVSSVDDFISSSGSSSTTTTTRHSKSFGRLSNPNLSNSLSSIPKLKLDIMTNQVETEEEVVKKRKIGSRTSRDLTDHMKEQRKSKELNYDSKSSTSSSSSSSILTGSPPTYVKQANLVSNRSLKDSGEYFRKRTRASVSGGDRDHVFLVNKYFRSKKPEDDIRTNYNIEDRTTVSSPDNHPEVGRKNLSKSANKNKSSISPTFFSRSFEPEDRTIQHANSSPSSTTTTTATTTTTTTTTTESDVEESTPTGLFKNTFSSLLVNPFGLRGEKKGTSTTTSPQSSKKHVIGNNNNNNPIKSIIKDKLPLPVLFNINNTYNHPKLTSLVCVMGGPYGKTALIESIQSLNGVLPITSRNLYTKLHVNTENSSSSSSSLTEDESLESNSLRNNAFDLELYEIHNLTGSTHSNGGLSSRSNTTDTSDNEPSAPDVNKILYDVHLIVLVFSISDPKSILLIPPMLEVLHKIFAKHPNYDLVKRSVFKPKILLVGTHGDCDVKQIEQSKCAQLASIIRCPYVEVSTKTGKNVSTLLPYFVEATKERHMFDTKISHRYSLEIIKNLKSNFDKTSEGETPIMKPTFSISAYAISALADTFVSSTTHGDFTSAPPSTSVRSLVNTKNFVIATLYNRLTCWDFDKKSVVFSTETDTPINQLQLSNDLIYYACGSTIKTWRTKSDDSHKIQSPNNYRLPYDGDEILKFSINNRGLFCGTKRGICLAWHITGCLQYFKG
eukprot:TRINITY_DN1607_c0_g4_i1.p1 TRINITY_DN1607_c0_g4~~TRINITY_DN1607_c0_g4_i1.p1  ORF type:complete len:1299 (-),score=396.55 TRINITY_DN1607_c0_g4_i1:758-4654(-)